MNKCYDQADLIILAPSQQEFASVCSVRTNGTQYMYIFCCFLLLNLQWQFKALGRYFYRFQNDASFMKSLYTAEKCAACSTIYSFDAHSHRKFWKIWFSFSQISGNSQNYLGFKCTRGITLYSKIRFECFLFLSLKDSPNKILSAAVYRCLGDILEINFKWIWVRNQEDFLKYVESFSSFAIYFLEVLSQESLKYKKTLLYEECLTWGK